MAHTFSALTLKKWRQFESVELDLSPNLCVLTGPNGCGKTTILNVLGRHFGWSLNFLSAPFLSRKKRRFYTDAWEHREAIEKDLEPTDAQPEVGQLTYSNAQVSKLLLAKSDRPQYALKFDNQQSVTGLHVPSHRPPPAYHQLTTIPVDPKTTQQQYQDYQNHLLATYGQQSSQNPASVMKETLISLAIFGQGNDSVQPNAEYARMFSGFQGVLAKLLPETIGFDRIEVRSPDVVLKTKTGTFALESMSGGLNALFGIAWQIHTFGFDKESCTVLIDEPENHLHPSMQRELLPKLVAAFPSYKFIVATHSPFVVSSKPDAAVYALVYNEQRNIVSKLLSEADLAASPNKVLRDVLDVPVTMPIWVEQRIDEVLTKYRGAEIDADTISKIRADLDANGLGEAFGDFLVQRNEPEAKA
jgi:predicted ATPase